MKNSTIKWSSFNFSFLCFAFLCSLAAVYGLIIEQYLVSVLLFFIPLTILLLGDLLENLIYIIVILTFIDILVLNGKLVELFPVLLIPVYWMEKEKYKNRDNTLIGPLILFLCLAFTGLFFSSYFSFTLDKVIRLSLLVSTFHIFCSVFFSNRNIIKNVIFLFLIVATIDSVTILVQRLILNYGRPFGISGVPSVDLIVSSSLILFVFSMLRTYKKASDFLYPILFLVNIIALYFMQTRNSILSFAFGLMAMMVLLYVSGSELIRKKLRNVFLVFAGLTVVFIYISFISESADVKDNRYAMETNAKGLKLSSFHTRILIWDTALTVFFGNPIIGVGFNSFSKVSKDYYTIKKDLFDLFVRDLDAHLPFLDLLAGMGIIGGTIILFIFFRLFKIIKDHFRIFQQMEEEYPFFTAISVVNLTIIISFFYSGSWFYGQNSFQMIIFWACLAAFPFSKPKTDELTNG